MKRRQIIITSKLRRVGMEFDGKSPQVIGEVNEVESRNGHYLNGEFC